MGYTVKNNYVITTIDKFNSHAAGYQGNIIRHEITYIYLPVQLHSLAQKYFLTACLLYVYWTLQQYQ